MRPKLLFYFILLTCIALFGLSSVQWFWMRKAQQTEHNIFRNTVNAAVNDALTAFEQQNFIENITSNKEVSGITKELDSLNNIMVRHKHVYAKSKKRVNEIPVSINQIEANNFSDATTHRNFELTITNDTLATVCQPGDSNCLEYEHYLKLRAKKNDLVKELKLIVKTIDKSITYRNFYLTRFNLPISMLDSLIQEKFQEEGIEVEYEYGIYNAYRSVFLYQKTGNFTENLKKSPYIYKFPPEVQAQGQKYLIFYFPHEQRFIYSHLWNVFFIAILLVITLIFSFSYAFRTLFKQKKLSDLKNDFINNMTHELKTPISAIGLVCEVLNDQNVTITPEMQKYYTGVIQQENKRLQSLVEQILQIVRIESGYIGENMEYIDIHKTINDVVNQTNFIIERRGGSVLQVLNAENSIIYADKTHIVNMLYNLIDNANKYTINEPEIVISSQNVGNNIIISIKDNGIGISNAQKERIFEKLYRVPTGNVHNVKGFGLGLSYVKTIVEKHGGKITVESELDKGSTFIIALPQHQEDKAKFEEIVNQEQNSEQEESNTSLS